MFVIELKDGSQLEVAQVVSTAVNARDVIFECDDVGTFAASLEALEENAGYDMSVKDLQDKVVDVVSEYMVTGSQLVPNMPSDIDLNKYTAHVYVSCKENRSKMIEYYTAARILLGEEV